MNSGMSPPKALAWTLAYILAASSVFWSGLSEFIEAPYRYWFVYLLFLCLLVPLSWFIYRNYRNHKGFKNPYFSKIPKREQRTVAMVGAVFFICSAVLIIVLAWLSSEHRPSYFAAPIVWLVLGADSWRRYLELKGPEVSLSQ